MKQRRLHLFAIVALLLASCSSTATLTIKAPYSYGTDDSVRHANITAISEKKVYHVEDVTLPYHMKVKYKHLPLQLNVATDSVAYKSYFIDGNDIRNYGWFYLSGAGAMSALAVTLFTQGGEVPVYIGGVSSSVMTILFAYMGIDFLTETPYMIPGDGVILLEKPYGQTKIENLRTKNELLGIYALIDKTKYKLARTNAEYFLNQAEKAHDYRHLGELNYLIGVCDYHLKNYKTAIKRFSAALTYDDIRFGFLQDNTIEYRELAQQAHDGYTNSTKPSSRPSSQTDLRNESNLMYTGEYTITGLGTTEYATISIYENQLCASVECFDYKSTNSIGERVYKGTETFGAECTYYVNANYNIRLVKSYYNPYNATYNNVTFTVTKGMSQMPAQQSGNAPEGDNSEYQWQDHGTITNPVQPHQVTTSCSSCHGPGKCPTCNGKHWYYGIGGSKVTCPNCTPNGACSSCGGSGKKTNTKYY